MEARHPARRGLLVCLCVGLAGLAQPSWGQRSSNWRVYKIADGMPEPACVSVTLGPKGTVLARHLNLASLSVLDGYTLTVLPAPGIGSNRIYGSPGGQLWTVVRGGLQEFKRGSWVFHPLRQLQTLTTSGTTAGDAKSIPLCPVRQGVVIILLPDRLLSFNAQEPEPAQVQLLRLAEQTQLGKFSGMELARDGGLWVTGTDGLAKVAGPVRNPNPESAWNQFLPPDTLHVRNLQQPHEDQEGVVTMVAESATNRRTLVVHFDARTEGREGHWTAESTGEQQVLQCWRGPNRTLWAATSDALLEWEEGQPELTETEEISARRYYDLALEPGGAFWLATSAGLFRYAPLTWRSPAPVRGLNGLVRCLTEDGDGRLWFVSGNALFALQEDHQQFALRSPPAGVLPVPRALFSLKDGRLVFDSGGQLFQYDPASGSLRVLALPAGCDQARILGRLKGGDLCLQLSSTQTKTNDSLYRVETFDGQKFEAFVESGPEEMEQNSFSLLFTAQNGDLWFGGDQGVVWVHEEKWESFLGKDKASPEGALDFVELPDGRLWCATPDKIWEFDGRSWSAVRSGFDRINRMVRTRDGSIWVASNSGLYRFFRGAWVGNGVEEGLPSAGVREVYEDMHGRIWAGTTHGLSLYHPDADPDPPRTFIDEPVGEEKNIPEGHTVNLTFEAQDKWKYTPRERLLYSYRLDDREWSPFQEANRVMFTDLPAGKHYFQARAMDRNCNVDPKPAQCEFSIIVPWYKERRLVLISIGALAVAVFFGGVAVNRHRRLLRSYAEVEQKVIERTRELEIANRELFHSQKMNALGTLAAGIAHDFNNILSIIKGSAQIIEDNLDNPQKISIRTERIRTVVEQGAGIVKAMLGFGRNSDAQPGPCDVNSVVEDTLKLLGDRFLHELEVSFQREPDLPLVPASKDFIQQILLNFLFNAADASTGAQQVILATERLTKLPAELALAPGAAAAYVCVSVRDFGCGITAENLPRIFEPFFTTKAFSARRGTGLGLSMVYELAKKMGAGLAVESIVGQGSRFSLILAAVEVAATA